MKKSIFLLLAVFFNLNCTQSKSKVITEVSQDELNEIVLVDVRTPEEFKMGHLENALNINWYDEDFTEQFKQIEKDNIIYVYCKAGGRSKEAQQKLFSLGYKKVVNLEGGYDAWLARQTP